MKKIVCIMLVFLPVLYTMSCKDFLEKPVTDEVVLDEIFASKELASKVMVMCYINLPFPLPVKNIANVGVNARPYAGVGKATLDCLTDLMQDHIGQVSGPISYYYTGLYNSSMESSNPAYVKYSFTADLQWESIRRCWTVIENIDKVPESEMSQKEKDEFKAQARVIIAIHYLEMFRHLGGVPKVTRTFLTSDGFETERMTIRQMMDWIAELIDAAADDLPDNYDNREYGRITRIGALAVKARMLHFAASPLYNDDVPYLNDDVYEANTKFYTWLGEKDNNMWKDALEAADYVITEALAHGYALVKDVPGTTATLNNPYRAAFRKAYFEPNNGEHLLTTRAAGYPQYYALFNNNGLMFSDYHNYGSFNPMQNWADMFPMNNGFDIDPSMPNYDEKNGYNDQLPNKDRDPRYYESIITNNDIFGTASPQRARMWIGGNEFNVNRLCTFGTGSRKFHLGGVGGNVANIGMPAVFPYIRLAEVYLNYAEAVNQWEGSSAAQKELALERVNAIRERVGLPGLPATILADRNKFHAAIMKERCCEFGQEYVRWFDMIRWKMEDDFKKPLRGVRSWLWDNNQPDFKGDPPIGTRENCYGADIPGLTVDDAVVFIGDGTIGTNGVKYVRLPNGAKGDGRTTANISTGLVEGRHFVTYQYYDLPAVNGRYWQRNFSAKYYLSAFPINEINKDYGLVQNPGW